MLSGLQKYGKNWYIGSESGGKIHLVTADFSNLDSILSAVSSICGYCGSLDMLINNAGLFCDTHQLTEQGLEMTVGVNYAAPRAADNASFFPFLKNLLQEGL